MKIIAVSDFHGSMEASRKTASKAEKTHADVIVVSGDITHFGSVQDAKELLSPLSKLQLPVFSVPGNCDPPSLTEINMKNARCIHGSCETYDKAIFAGVGSCPITPFYTPFEVNENAIMVLLNQSTTQCRPRSWLILVSHTS